MIADTLKALSTNLLLDELRARIILAKINAKITGTEKAQAIADLETLRARFRDIEV